METKVKNSDLYPIAQQLSVLQREKIPLGQKNRIQKIVRLINEHFVPYNNLHVELLKKHGATQKPNAEVSFDPKEGEKEVVTPSEFTEEFSELSAQTNTMTFDPVDYSKIVDAESDQVYNFELLSPFFENYKL